MMILSLVVCVIALCQCTGAEEISSLEEVQNAWNKFKVMHERNYASNEEEMERLAIFTRNYNAVKKHNSKGASYTMEINYLSDWNEQELKQLRGIRYDKQIYGSYFNYTGAPVPSSWDWRDKGAVSAVKNQGACGSCWSFSTTGSVEGQMFIKKKKTVSLSEQQLVDCDTDDGGCQGGWPATAVHYITSNGGIESETAYPYKSGETQHRGSCKFTQSKVVAKTTGWVNLPHKNEEALTAAIANIGPISVAIDAAHSEFYSYKSGVYDNPKCTQSIDHGVLAVGYGTLDGKDYYIVKNSWGKYWGKEGYIYMSRNNDNQCAIASYGGYPTV